MDGIERLYQGTRTEGGIEEMDRIERRGKKAVDDLEETGRERMGNMNWAWRKEEGRAKGGGRGNDSKKE